MSMADRGMLEGSSNNDITIDGDSKVLTRLLVSLVTVNYSHHYIAGAEQVFGVVVVSIVAPSRKEPI